MTFNKTQQDILKQELNIELNEEKLKKFEEYERFFISKNSQINLISKNDEKLLFEKHIFDSLAINKFLKPKDGETILDIGTGGGFPSVPIAILYDNLNVYAIDSIRKKIKVIEEIKTELKLDNLHPICDRVENLNQKFDYVTTRAVASLDKILKYAIPRLKLNGKFIAFKSQKIDEEMSEAQKTIKNLRVKVSNIIEYSLPLEASFKRYLIIFEKAK